ncbi:MAG: FAD-binding oxidoreductase [Paracoccaceae bacterium]
MNLLFSNDQAGEYPNSYYADTATKVTKTASLKGDHKTTVCVIGGGYTGLSAALHLAQAGIEVTLLEAHRLGFGASGRNGGQVGSGQRRDQIELEQILEPAHARRLWDLAQEAKQLVRDLISIHNMPVTFTEGVAHACRRPDEVKGCHKLAEKLAQQYGYDQIEILDKAGIRDLMGSLAFHGGEIDWGAGHIHPLNFAIGIGEAAKGAGAQIFESTLVTKIETGAQSIITTSQGKVRADHVILACNGYLGDLAPKVSARVMPINNFIIATEPLGENAVHILAKPVAVADTQFLVNYWRLSDDNRLLFGGGESYGYRFPDIVKTVTKPMLKIYPQLAQTKIDYAWGGTLAITMNRLPNFQKLKGQIWSASGYSGHGVAIATLAGRLMADAIQGQAEGFDLMSSLPQPRFPGGTLMRWPLLVLAMTWYEMRDRLGR